LRTRRVPRSTLFPYTTLFRSVLRIERDELGPEGARIRRHDGQEAVMGSDGEHGAYRLDNLARGQRRERLRDGGNEVLVVEPLLQDRKSTRLNSSHVAISYAVF